MISDIIAKGREYYTDDDEYDEDELYDIFEHACYRYMKKGCSMLEAVKRATEYLERKTDFSPSPEYIAALLEQARRMDRKHDTMTRSAPSARPRQNASSGDYEDYDRAQKSARSAQSTSGTEYDRMFQHGADRYASRTSGKLLSSEGITACAKQMMQDLIVEGKNPRYVQQKVDQFVIRENGKRVAALRQQGYRFPDDDDDEVDDATARSNARRGTGRKTRETDYVDDVTDDDDYDTRRTRSGYANHAESKETYDTSYPYTDEDLRLIRKKIYQDWCGKGCTPHEAKLGAEAWYNKAKKNRRGGGKSSRSSGFDTFSSMREALDDKDDYLRQKSRASRESRSRKSGGGSPGYRTEERCPPGRDGPQYGKYFTEEPQGDNHPRGKTGRGSRGYRTEERRPGDSYSSGSYGGYDELGGVKPASDLYKLLGVSKKATVAEITKAWKKLCLQHHPDRVSGTAAKKTATNKMAQINEAKDVLADAELRAYYDRTDLIANMGESPDS